MVRLQRGCTNTPFFEHTPSVHRVKLSQFIEAALYTYTVRATREQILCFSISQPLSEGADAVNFLNGESEDMVSSTRFDDVTVETLVENYYEVTEL